MARPTVIQPRRMTAAVEARLEAEFDVILRCEDQPLGVDEIRAQLGEADALIPTVADPVDADTLAAGGERLKIVANFGVGYDNVDIEAAKSHGVVVTNTPGVLTDATADLALTLLLMAARRTGEGERICRRGAWRGWQPTQLLGQDVSGKTLGLVGFGRIGEAVAKRAHLGFGMRILVNTRRNVGNQKLARYQARQTANLDELLAQSDFVSLHCPDTPETRGLIDSAAINKMQATAILINTARGTIVDEPALVAALKRGDIAGAALDVYAKEPSIEPELLDLENVVLLPHLGSATEETRTAMGMCMLDNLLAFFAGCEVPDRVA